MYVTLLYITHSNFEKGEKMELMDWKNIESGAKAQIKDADTQKEIGQVLLEHALAKIEILELDAKN